MADFGQKSLLLTLHLLLRWELSPAYGYLLLFEHEFWFIYVYLPNFCYFTFIKSKLIIFCSVLHLLPSFLRCGPHQAAQHPLALTSIHAPISFFWGKSPGSPFMSAPRNKETTTAFPWEMGVWKKGTSCSSVMYHWGIPLFWRAVEMLAARSKRPMAPYNGSCLVLRAQ